MTASFENDGREQWATRIGFILAAVGSAVGLGNVWRFPFQVGQEGGSAFLLVYLLFVVLVGLPAILVEFTVGRRTERDPVGALRNLAGGVWTYVGGLFILIGIIILSYYSVVAGWALRYILGSASGAYMADPAGYFGSIAVGTDAVVFHALFVAATVGIVALGIQRGIELAVKVMVPAIIALMVGLAIYAVTLPGVGEAYAYYLSPDFGTLAAEWQSIIPAAAGQAFFTLSLGMGVMITYASYLGEDRNLAEDAGIIIVFDTGIAILAGLVVFPILFASGIGPADPGAGAVFIALANGFAEIPFGQVLGLVFFLVLSIAALSSAISILEVVVSFLMGETSLGRRSATAVLGLVIFLLGIPVTVDTVMVDLYDILAANVLLVAGSVLLMVLVGWLTADTALDELQRGIGTLGARGTIWIWLVRVPVILVLLVALYLGIADYAEFLRTDFAEFLAGR